MSDTEITATAAHRWLKRREQLLTDDHFLMNFLSSREHIPGAREMLTVLLREAEAESKLGYDCYHKPEIYL